MGGRNISMIEIPNAKTKKWTQPNVSDILGDLWASFNLDLTENRGAIRLGKRLLINTNTSDVAEITSYPAAFKVLGTVKYAIAGASGTGYAFSNSTAYPGASTFSKITAATSPTTVDSAYSDMEVSNGNLYVSTKSNTVHCFDGSSWTSFTVGAADAGSTHMMTSFGGRTYMTKLKSLIQSWNSSNSVADPGNQYTLQLGNSDSNVITFLRSSANRIWIGTVNTLGGKGYIYEWDGSSTQATRAYRLEAAGALACVIKDDIPYVVDSNGDLLVWNAGNFQKITGLNRRRNKLLFNPLSSINDRFIHPNGMSIVEGNINILIDGRNYDNSAASTSLEETIPSGIWEYTSDTGLYHKHSFGLSRAAGTITDYGQARIVGAGALAELNIPSTTPTRNGTFLAGASYYTTATVSTSAIFYDDSNDTEQKAGYLVTTKLQSSGITDNFLKIFPKYRKFLASTDRMILKYRTSEQEPTEMTITWVAGSTQFTTTDSNMANYAVGDEVEIVAGNGAGMCSHITAISENAGTYTVTVDLTYNSSTATAKARLQKWVEIGTISDQGSSFKQFNLPRDCSDKTWIQFKVWMLFTGKDELISLNVMNTENQKT